MICRKHTWILFLVTVAVLLSGCGGKGEPAASGEDQASAAVSEKKESPSGEPSKTPEGASAAPTSAKPAETAAQEPTAVSSPTPLPSPTPVPTPTTDPKGMAVDGWIAGIPAYVPQFDYGSLDLDTSKVVEGSVSSVFSLCFHGIAKADLDAYGTLLQSQGYSVAVAEIDRTYTLTASLSRGREIATLVITLSESQGVAIYTLGAAV